MSYWSGLQNFIESEYFNLTVRKELEKVFSVIPSYKYDVAYRKVIEEEIEENTKTFLRGHSHQHFDEEQIDEI
ncbi:MAG: hypothetical protein N2316_05600 [Spirochaetes bacterium]|nr:hypothetical protein [Spirochaetota bacterium]